MKKTLLGIAIGASLPPLAGLAFILLGGMPVATKGPPLPFERWIAKKALHAAFKEDLDKQAPFEANEGHLLAAAKVYRMQCAVCHGLPEQPATAIAKGLFPRPPQLFEPRHSLHDDPIGEIYWKAKNGIRLTGMPGFVDTLTDQELWEVSLLLQHTQQLSAGVKHTLHSH